MAFIKAETSMLTYLHLDEHRFGTLRIVPLRASSSLCKCEWVSESRHTMNLIWAGNSLRGEERS